MNIEEELLEPIKFYKYELQHKHLDKVEAFFDGLKDQSMVDVEANQQTCKEYYSLVNETNNLQGKLNSKRGLRGFLIAMAIVFFIVGTILFVGPLIGRKLYVPLIPIGVGLILFGVGFILINTLVLAKKIDSFEDKIKKLKEESRKKQELAYQQMAPLNALYDWGIPARLVTETTPIILMDKNYNVERSSYLLGNYGWKESGADNVSTIFIQSGTIVENPFLYERDYIQEMVPHVYTGHLTISWTTWTTDGKGNTRAVHHTQTLTATVTRPAAIFFTDTSLIYANEAAPKLSFSRQSSNANSMSEKEIEKESEKFVKTLQKKQEKDIKSSFTPLGNDRFEYLFNALNRDNEVEFRLLFTPLAQKNLISAITSKEPYGDDFSFKKKKMINIIHSEHAQSLSFDGNPYHFIDFDYERAREKFIDYNVNYFKGIYYDFVPLLSIPLYQQHKDYNRVHKSSYDGTITLHEAEVLSNFMDDNIFKPENCDTHIILKASFVSSNNEIDIFDIMSYGFQMIPQLEVVPKLGGDGHMHGVPVNYFDYERVEKHTFVAVMNVEDNKQAYSENRDQINELISNYSKSSDIIYQRGLLAFPLKEGVTTIDGEHIKELFKTKEK